MDYIKKIMSFNVIPFVKTGEEHYEMALYVKSFDFDLYLIYLCISCELNYDKAIKQYEHINYFNCITYVNEEHSNMNCFLNLFLYNEFKNIDLLKYCYENERNRFAITELANRCYHSGNEIGSQRYLTFARDMGCLRAVNAMGVQYFTQKKYKLAEFYFIIASVKSNISDYLPKYNLSLLYEKCQPDNHEMIFRYKLQTLKIMSMFNCNSNIHFNKIRTFFDTLSVKYYKYINVDCLEHYSLHLFYKWLKNPDKIYNNKLDMLMCLVNSRYSQMLPYELLFFIKQLKRLFKLIDMHFDYKPNSINFQTIKNNFNERCIG